MALTVSPRLSIDEECLHAATPWLAQLLWLFSYQRLVTVDRTRRCVTVSTRRLWLWRQIRVIRFERISRIIYQGQGLPSLLWWRHLNFLQSDGFDSAFFLIALGLKDPADEQPLFAIWEDQPSDSNWLNMLSGDAARGACVGDEAAVRLIDLLHEYIGVPIARH